jgi:small subunit ribosomal protein S4
LVNGKKVNIPSYLVSSGDTISVHEKGRELACLVDALKNAQEQALPNWLEMDYNTFTGTVAALPSREEITVPVKEQLIVELYSK